MIKQNNIHEGIISKLKEKVEHQIWSSDPDAINMLRDELDLYMMESGLTSEQMQSLKNSKTRLDNIETKLLLQGKFQFLLIF